MYTPHYSYHVSRHAGILSGDRVWSEAGFCRSADAIEFAKLIHDGLNFTSVVFVDPRNDVQSTVYLITPTGQHSER